MLAKVWGAWFLVYMVAGSFFHQRLLSGTVDRVDSWVVRAVVLNIPLQLGLFLVWVGTTRSSSATAATVGRVAIKAAVVLAAAHLLTSVATAWW